MLSEYVVICSDCLSAKLWAAATPSRERSIIGRSHLRTVWYDVKLKGSAPSAPDFAIISMWTTGGRSLALRAFMIRIDTVTEGAAILESTLTLTKSGQ